MKISDCSLQRGEKVDNYKIIELLGESVQLLNIISFDVRVVFSPF